jgi:hypothetical protein
VTRTNAPRGSSGYLTWRYPDRHFTKVHIVDGAGLPLCGRIPGRERGRPADPIPESSFCDECLARRA